MIPLMQGCTRLRMRKTKPTSLMVHVMSLHQWMQTMVARELSPNKETSLMVYMMSPYQLRQTKVAKGLSLNMEVF